MKSFTTLKVGYSAGVYGCSGEYFTTIVINGKKEHSFSFVGLYGAEERVNAKLKKMGYHQFYTRSHYGKLTGDDKRGFMSETRALQELDNLKEKLYPIRIK